MSNPTTLLRGIRWETYDRLVTEVESPTYLTYDDGRLEIVSPSDRHEWWKSLMGMMLTFMTAELGLPIKSGGSTTLRRRMLRRGMEPDECFWIQSEPRVRGKLDLDFDVDPVPDLVLESEASRSVLDRLAILAALGVPEVWRFDGDRLRILILTEPGGYVESTTSRCFPWLPVDPLAAHLLEYENVDQTTWILRFREWVRKTVRLP